MSDRHPIKRHPDFLTALEVAQELFDQYRDLGYNMGKKHATAFSYHLEDGTSIMVYWKDGMFYEEVVEAATV